MLAVPGEAEGILVIPAQRGQCLCRQDFVLQVQRTGQRAIVCGAPDDRPHPGEDLHAIAIQNHGERGGFVAGGFDRQRQPVLAIERHPVELKGGEAGKYQPIALHRGKFARPLDVILDAIGKARQPVLGQQVGLQRAPVDRHVVEDTSFAFRIQPHAAAPGSGVGGVQAFAAIDKHAHAGQAGNDGQGIPLSGEEPAARLRQRCQLARVQAAQAQCIATGVVLGRAAPAHQQSVIRIGHIHQGAYRAVRGRLHRDGEGIIIPGRQAYRTERAAAGRLSDPGEGVLRESDQVETAAAVARIVVPHGMQHPLPALNLPLPGHVGSAHEIIGKGHGVAALELRLRHRPAFSRLDALWDIACVRHLTAEQQCVAMQHREPLAATHDAQLVRLARLHAVG